MYWYMPTYIYMQAHTHVRTHTDEREHSRWKKMTHTEEGRDQKRDEEWEEG